MRMRLAALALLAGLVTGQAAAQTAASPPLTGRVAEVFGNRLVIDLGGERVLAEPVDPAASLDARPGDLVRVDGERRGPLVSWRAVSVTASAAPAAGAARPAGAPGNSDSELLRTVERLGLKAIDPPLRKRHHIEVLAQTAEGRKLYVSFDRDGRLWEIEDAAYDRDRVVPRNLSTPIMRGWRGRPASRRPARSRSGAAMWSWRRATAPARH